VNSKKSIWGGLSLAGIVFVSLSTGCGQRAENGPPRAKVSGTVTFHDKSIPTGTIIFLPEPGMNLPVSSARITDGKYAVEANGGVPIGKHRVEITGWAHAVEETLPTDMTTPNKNPQLLPDKYNTKSELELVVESTKSIQKDFVLD